ncbi:MAG: hypothetical protein AAGF86_15935, partial [Pseudomonadota bacterium]
MRSRVLRQCAVHMLMLGGVLGVTSLDALSALRSDPALQDKKAPLVAFPATAHGNVNFVEIDLNFDGRKDLAVVQRDERTAKPEVIYFLYDEAQKRFTRNQALGDLFSPEFDAHAKRVRTGWRQSGNLKISEVYGWSSDRLKLLERKELNLKTQECRATRFAWINETKWALAE